MWQSMSHLASYTMLTTPNKANNLFSQIFIIFDKKKRLSVTLIDGLVRILWLNFTFSPFNSFKTETFDCVFNAFIRSARQLCDNKGNADPQL